MSPDNKGVNALNDPNSPASLEILHKPRGSKGVWTRITMGQRVRVTHGRGKNLQIHIWSKEKLQASNIRLSLEEKTDGIWNTYNPSGFSVELQHKPIMDHNNLHCPHLLQIDVKLYVIHKLLSFVVEMNQSDGSSLKLRSVELWTHNSGRRETNCKYKRKSPTPLENGPYEISQMPHPETPKNIKIDPQELPYIPESQLQYHEDWTKIENNLAVNGAIKARSYQQFSDIRLKTNIGEITDAMSIVQSLHGKTYRWKKGISPVDGEVGGRRVLGLIAQEVKEVLPEVVEETNGILSINYTEIIPVLIEAFKQQSDEIKKLKDGVETSSGSMTRICVKLKHKENLSPTELEELRKKDMMLIKEYLDKVRDIKNQREMKVQHDSPKMKGYKKRDTYKLEYSPKSTSRNLRAESDSQDSDSIMLQIVYIPSNFRWKMLALVLLISLVTIGVVTGIVFGIIHHGYRYPVNSDNLLLSPSFEDIDTFGLASGWTGPYTLLMRGDNSLFTLQTTDRVQFIPENNNNASIWPFGVNPYHGRVMLQIYTDPSENEFFYAKTTVPLNTITKDIKYLNMTTWTASNFNLNDSNAASFFQLNIFLTYEDSIVEIFGVDFDYDDKYNWNLKELIIPCRKEVKPEFAEIVVLSTFNGYSFWDMLSFQYSLSDLPNYLRYAKQRSVRECNGMIICT